MFSAEDKPIGFSGTITHTSLLDIVQLICIGRHTCRMRVKSGVDIGTVYFRDGEIIHAQTNGLQGEEAFYTILTWRMGLFECDETEPEMVTIHESWDFLLMESMRRADKAPGH